MTMKLDVFYSYACRDSYLAYAWLKRLQNNGQALTVEWHPFAIQMDDPVGYWEQSWAAANSEFRGFVAAEVARQQGYDVFLRFHDALEIAVHEQFLELREESTLLGAAQRTGLDIRQFQRGWHDPRLVSRVRESHLQAVEQFSVFGTPTIVLPNGSAYHVELGNVPLGDMEIWNVLTTPTASYPYFARVQPVNLPGA